VSVAPDTCGGVEFSIKDDGSDANSKLNVIQIKKLRSLINWFSQVPAPPAARWFDLTDAEFRTWRTQFTLALPAAPAAAPTLSPTSSSLSAVSEFRKGVKRSASDCKAFKEDRFFLSWQRHLQITAGSHNVDNVINLTCTAAAPEEIALLHEQQKFFFSALEQTVLAPDGLLIIRNHSAAGNAAAACSTLVDRHGKSAAAELAAAETENDLIEFRMDASWTKMHSAFLQAWTNKSLDLDAVSAHPILDSQKRLWFTRAVAPKAVLSLAISQFDASEKLASRTQGTSYVKASFFVLCDHVSDVAARHDQEADKLLQSGARRANEAKVVAGDSQTPKDKTAFIGKDGERHSFVIPPHEWSAVTPIQRAAALAKIRADKGLPPKAGWQRGPPGDCQINSSNASLPASVETMTSYVEVANPNSGDSVVSGVTQQSSAEPPASSTPSLRQVLTAALARLLLVHPLLLALTALSALVENSIANAMSIPFRTISPTMLPVLCSALSLMVAPTVAWPAMMCV
jgi:hypothetical protein